MSLSAALWTLSFSSDLLQQQQTVVGLDCLCVSPITRSGKGSVDSGGGGGRSMGISAVAPKLTD